MSLVFSTDFQGGIPAEFSTAQGASATISTVYNADDVTMDVTAGGGTNSNYAAVAIDIAAMIPCRVRYVVDITAHISIYSKIGAGFYNPRNNLYHGCLFRTTATTGNYDTRTYFASLSSTYPMNNGYNANVLPGGPGILGMGINEIEVSTFLDSVNGVLILRGIAANGILISDFSVNPIHINTDTFKPALMFSRIEAKVHSVEVYDDVPDSEYMSWATYKKYEPKTVKAFHTWNTSNRSYTGVATRVGEDPANKIVRLFELATNTFAEQTTPDENGFFIFRDLQEGLEYTAIVFDKVTRKTSFPLSIDNFGSGQLAGVVKVRDEIAPNATVKLFRELDDTFLGQVTTGIDGAFAFNGFNSDERFYLVIVEPSGEWEWRVSSRRNPA